MSESWSLKWSPRMFRQQRRLSQQHWTFLLDPVSEELVRWAVMLTFRIPRAEFKSSYFINKWFLLAVRCQFWHNTFTLLQLEPFLQPTAPMIGSARWFFGSCHGTAVGLLLLSVCLCECACACVCVFHCFEHCLGSTHGAWIKGRGF